MRIAIELDNIVRDNNAQALKYYWKGYDNNFDEDVDLGCSDLLSMLPFKSNKARKEFREIDYPYELFGCAKTTQKNLHVEMEDWMESNEDIEVIYFSLHRLNLYSSTHYWQLVRINNNLPNRHCGSGDFSISYRSYACLLYHEFLAVLHV